MGVGDGGARKGQENGEHFSRKKKYKLLRLEGKIHICDQMNLPHLGHLFVCIADAKL